MVKGSEVNSAEDFMALGLSIAGYDLWKSYKLEANIERFKKHYGVTPTTCADVWRDLKISTDERIHVGKKGKPANLLLACRFLFKYDTQTDLGSFFKIRSDKTVGKWCEIYVSKLALLLRSKKITSFTDADIGLHFLYTVDGTHCPIEEPFPFSTIWSSHKLGGKPGVSYEIALCIYTSRLLWLHGPTPPGKQNDIRVFKEKFMGEIQQYMDSVGGRIIKGLGDKGYRGASKYLSTHNNFDPPEIVEFKDRAMARQETYNQRLKVFKVLTEVFRHPLDFHPTCMEAVNALTVYQLENGSTLLFDPYP
jgi:hypothetical protein